MSRIKGASVAIVLGGLVFTSHGALAALIQNGDFELPAVTLNTIQQATPTGWSWGGGTAGWIVSGQVYSGWPTAQQGVQFLDIGNGPSFGPLSQTFTIAQPGTYYLHWFDSAGADSAGSPYSVTVVDGSGGLIGDLDFNSAHGGGWQGQSMNLVLDTGDYTLRFQSTGAGGGNYDTILDNVNLTVVPEPGTTIPAIAVMVFSAALLERRRLSKGVESQNPKSLTTG